MSASPIPPVENTGTSKADDLDRLRTEYARREDRLAGQNVNSLLNPGQLYLIQQRQRELLSLFRREGFESLSDKRILEVGCGSGGVLRELLWIGAKPTLLNGVELLDWRLAEAKTATPNLPLVNADGRYLPYADHSFDLVLQFTVFSSILDEEVKQAIAAEMRRVVRPNGLIVWYDFWLNPKNKQTRGILPAEIRKLFSDCRCDLRRITLAPPIARRLAPLSWLGCHLLESSRIFNTHYLAAIRPR